MRECDVGPDGHLVAFGRSGIKGVRVYEAATGKRIWQSPLGEGRHNDYSHFSTDGRWLLLENDGGRAFAVDSWESGARLGPGCPWDLTPDGHIAVVGQPDGIYRLVERATGRELARLEDPDQQAGYAAFTPDGTRIVVETEGGAAALGLAAYSGGIARAGP